MPEATSLTSGISGRYATALFELARDEGTLDALERDLAAFAAAIAESADLRDLLTSPVYRREEQGRAITAVAEAMEAQALTRNTLALMASKRRLFAVPKMVAMARALIADHRGEITAEVTSAKPLSEAQSAALAEALKRALGQEVRIETDVDAELIGGLVVKVGSRMVDTSIRAKLDSMHNAMKEVG